MSSFFPSIGTLPILDGAIQTGRGVAAGVLGQTYSIRRLTQPSGANGAVSSQAPVYTNYPARIRRVTSKVKIENDIFSLVCYEATCDNRVLELFDEMTETGYEAMQNGVYIFAQARPTRETLWMRAESNIAITRPYPTAGQAAQQPSSGWVAAAPGTEGVLQKDEELVMTLTDGPSAFGAAGSSPASIQCALQPLNRLKDTSQAVAAGKWPVSLYREMFVGYLPLLPGEQLNELDRLNFPNSDRYEIALLFTTEQTGLAGYVFIAERLGV